MVKKTLNEQLPNSIKIGWKDVKIERVKTSFIKNNSDYWGQYVARENKIEIQEEAKGLDLANTLLHEVIHAIVYHSSLNAQGGPLHDPNVIVYLLNPEIYSGRLVNVEVEVNSELTRGMTVVDWWYVTDRLPNAYYINAVKEDEFFEIVLNNVLNLEI